jgi:NADH-quinone oxidoreductase subunit A
MLFQLANVLVFFVIGAAFVGVMLGLGRWLRPSSPNPAKLSTYECGEPATGSAWINFNIRFYLIALVFLIFDVELAFMYPVLVVYRDAVAGGRAVDALVKIALFVLVLFLGIVYTWVKRDLEWMKQVPAEGGAMPEQERRAA